MKMKEKERKKPREKNLRKPQPSTFPSQNDTKKHGKEQTPPPPKKKKYQPWLMDSEPPLISDRGRLASKLPTQPKQKHAGLGKMTVRSLSHLSTLLPAYHIAALSSFEPFEA